MKKPVIEKVTVNIGVGEGGEKLEKAVTLLRNITGHQPVKTKTMKRIPAFGVRPRTFVGAMVTLRSGDAEEFLRSALAAKGNSIPKRSFDRHGNFAFGIAEYIDLPGVNYEPEIGVFGMDVCVTVGRKGYRVKRRRIQRNKVGKDHQLSREESIKHVQEEFGVEVTE